MTQLSIRVEDDKRIRFVKAARMQGSDASTIIREYIDEYLNQHEKKDTLSQQESTIDSSVSLYFDLGKDLQEAIGRVAAREFSKKSETLTTEEFIQLSINKMMENGIIIPKEFVYLNDRTKFLFIAGLN